MAVLAAGYLLTSMVVMPAPNQLSGQWARPTAELAADFLTAEQAADVVTHEIDKPIFEGGFPLSYRFIGKAVARDDGYCSRKSYYVPIVEQPSGGVPQAPIEGFQVRQGGCDGIFAAINPGATLDGAVAVLRWLDWARSSAKGSGPVPIKLSCIDQQKIHDRCGPGAQAALAAFPIHKTTIITKATRTGPHKWHVIAVETVPGQANWTAKIDATPGQEAIDLVWQIPAPF